MNIEIQNYSEKTHQKLLSQTRATANRLIDVYPDAFGLERLIESQQTFDLPHIQELTSIAIREAYLNYIENDMAFEHTLDWMLVWKQQLSFKSLGDKYGCEKVIASIKHTRACKAIHQIYLEKLDGYMQWFPWSWFSNIKFIGAGGFSAVYSANMTPVYDFQSVQMALKVVDNKLLNEIAIQSKAFSPVLFQGLTVCESTGDLMMVMKLSNNGNLEDHMKQLPLGDLDLKTIVGTLLRLAANLADLHQSGLCHRNVHPRNIICTDSDYFLVDYRYAAPTLESCWVTATTKAVYGRLPYVAPEVQQGIYTEKSDVYSLGIIIWQLVSKVIFPCSDVLLDGDRKGWSNQEHVYRIEPVPGLPEWYQRLYTACLEPEPKHRPNAIDICTALQPFHHTLEYSVPLNRHVAEYVVARRAETVGHYRTFTKVRGGTPDSTSSLYTLSSLPSTKSLILLPFQRVPFENLWDAHSYTIPITFA
ncbi:kinase-like domain-containing protein [Sporodiniella umbellata]|nr:kinase-like domain-containing protein [Sporodiniella umbellata]